MCNDFCVYALQYLMDLSTQRAIIEKAKRNPELFGEIFTAYYSKIYKFAVYKTGDVIIAEDIAAATFLKSYVALGSYVWRGISIEAWLYTIALNEIRMYGRKSKANVSLDELYETQGYEMPSDYDLMEDLLAQEHAQERQYLASVADKALKRLPAHYAEVLILRYKHSKKIAEIAAELGKSEGTVKSLISRGLKRMKRQLIV